MIILDNAESILDPEGTDSQEIYSVVEELGQFDNIWLLITSRISTVPPDYEILDIPTLSMDAACDAFYGTYKKAKRSDVVDKILEQLDFHPLSVTLLATVAHQNRWDAGRLTKEWERRRTGVLRTDHKKSLADTIELSLVSPMFQELGPNARALLEVLAFFPQGIDEKNLGWLFPTISNRENIFDKFCVLSLTYRSNGFATMLAPLRDHLYPEDPRSSPLLCATKDHYFSRLSVASGPEKSNFEETRWIVSEDVNVEHVLDVFSSIDADSNNVWEACADFLQHLVWHKPRPIVLGSRIEGLPNNHPSKLRCLDSFATMLGSYGNFPESRRLLGCMLKFWREQGSDHKVAGLLVELASANWALGIYAEGISQAKEALEIYEKLNETVEQVDCLHVLASLFIEDNQVNAAEEATSRAVIISLDEPSKSQLREHYLILGHMCRRRGETGAANGHYMKALGIARSLNQQGEQLVTILSLVTLLVETERFDDALVHLDHLKLDVANNPRYVGVVMQAQARVLLYQGKLEEARSEMLRTIGLYEGIGVSAGYMDDSKKFLQEIEGKINERAASNL